ncbi:MAG: NADH-quinone oxidoreductase subunit NuoG [Armatimonadetes bacterium]|nr:NADH-quinone oxidoreductase subunit NuoG [Armatimonadota bacterium]
MAVAEGLKLVKVTINDTELEVPSGELIVESVKRIGAEIPVFCYHPRMKPVGMCRMCLVEVGFKQPDGSVRMMPKPQAGCTLPASEGMVVYTDSVNVHRDRRGVLEFLLANHPLDCPICDRGGECPLQNNTLAYGPSTSRFIELKRHLPKAFPLSKYVTLDLERCIQCGRCVRFTEEISGEAELAFRFRGASMQPSTFQMTDFESKFSGNVIEICPVGALTSAKYRFRARPWDVETSPAVCTECSNGCSVWFDHRAGKFVRINGRANEAVNEEWTCDKGKFGHDYYNSPARLTRPLARRGSGFVEVSWAEAYEEIAKAFDRPGNELAALTGPRVANEGLFMMKKLFTGAFGSTNIEHRWTTGQLPRLQEWVSSTIAGLEAKKTILVIGSDLASDLPIVFLRVRKAATQHGATVRVATAAPTEVDQFATSSIRLQAGGEAEGALALLNGDWASDLGPDTAVVAADSFLDLKNGSSVLEQLRKVVEAKGAEFSCFPTGTNSMGAAILGCESPEGSWAILEAVKKGSVKCLWLTECDLATLAGGQEALEAAEFVVVQGTLESETMAYANVVLPMAAPAEQEGTWTNCEKRVQRIRQAIATPGDAKPAWRIFAEMSLRMQPDTPFFNAREVQSAMAAAEPAFAALASEIPDEGVLVGSAATPEMAENVTGA